MDNPRSNAPVPKNVAMEGGPKGDRHVAPEEIFTTQDRDVSDGEDSDSTEGHQRLASHLNMPTQSWMQ